MEITSCDDTSSAPQICQLLQAISLLGRWSSSGSDRGIAHFFIATRNTIKGVGEKEQTNNMLGLTQGVREELCNIAFPMCICRLTLAWISSENSTTHEECWLILTALPSLTLGPYLMPTAHFCCPVSTGHSHHPSQLTSVSSFVRLLLAFPCLLLITSRSQAQAFVCFGAKPNKGLRLRPLFGFAPKQTKGSSAWRTTYIVLHSIR